MNRLTRFFMQRTTLFWSLMIGIIIAGILAFFYMPKLEDPAIGVKQAMVIVPYPGASAHEVELNVARLMEDELRALPDVYKIRTDCQDGMATITVEFRMSVLMKDVEQHFDLLRRKVTDLKSRLPEGSYDPIVMDDMMDVYGILYSLTGDGYDYPEQERYAKYLRRELLAVPGVKRVTIGGSQAETVEIILSKEEIARNGLLPTQIMMALQQSGKPANAGAMTANSERYRLEVADGVATVNELRNLIINTLDGKQVRLADVATIRQTLTTPRRNAIFVNGQPALTIGVAMENDAIVPDVGKAVDQRMNEALAALPAGLQTDKIFFQPDKVSSAISSFMLNLLESVVIVIIVLIFAMGFRAGLIIGFGLILTIALSFPILLQCGTTLQRISLGAFIVAMGMLVDNAVVIMDGILVDRRRGLPESKYLYRVGANTQWPLLGATIIAAATFICIYLSPDSVGEYAGDLFLVLCVSLLASWVLALIQVPVCAKAWLPKNDKNKSADSPMNSPTHRLVRRTVKMLINHKTPVIITSIIVLAICGFGMTRVKNSFFPDFDYKQYVVECYFPAQTSPEEAESEMRRMAAIVAGIPENERVVISMGAAPARYCLVRPMSGGGDRYGELIVDCPDYEAVVRQLPEMRRKLREAFPGVYIRMRKYNFSISTSHTVEVEFSGPDPAELRRLSAKAEDIMRRCKYVDTYSVQNNWNPTGKTVVADFDIQNGLRAGVNRQDVANALLAATDGMPVGVMTNGDSQMIVNLKVRNANGSEINDLHEIPVWSTPGAHPDGERITTLLTSGHPTAATDEMLKAVPLGSVANNIHLTWEENMVRRLNGKRVIEAECDPNFELPDATPAKVIELIKPQIESIPLPPGYSMRWVGEGELQSIAIGNVMKYVPITIFLVLAILLLLFNSWRKVTLILICFPFVICGIVAALLLTGNPFTFMAIIGFMGLIGMMVKNSIVLVDEIGRLQTEEGHAPYDAVVEATVSRVRPVLMASITTIVGMIPLLTDPMYSSMAVTIMGGLAAGTIITLLLLPLFYTVIMRIKTPSENHSESSK